MKLYALCDAATLKEKNISLEDFVRLAKEKNVDVIQYRNKDDATAVVKENLIKLRSLWDKKLIINDYIELVTFCDGLHVGQDDIKKLGDDTSEMVRALRRHVTRDKWLGISTHNEQEVKQANMMELDYIGLGAYRTTSTKDVETVLGDKLDSIAKLSKHPVAAIGGVTLDDTFDHVSFKVIGRAIYED
ncbi:MAG: thiamine phosphate synthase [Thiovulaceae bacterium]|nr:thiamine phosphate synthase [Sulfurimonadaceae bacterium]